MSAQPPQPPGRADLSHLDVESLRTFKDSKVNGVQWFINELVVLTTDPPDPAGGTTPVDDMPSLSEQSGSTASFANSPLKLGRLGAPKEGDKLTAASLLGFVKRSAGTLAGIELQQQDLFNNISQNLAITIAAMESAQDSSLDQVEANKFLDDWANINNGLVPPKSV
ncbi:type VII secretion system-associated protein [Streptomyces sp. NPDC006798]|uniref:type VII secretion system-associated protein n=1 Tax=Streptomyces sp. NPDC006798 TaxID=3155462 RepID=UPI0033E0A727